MGDRRLGSTPYCLSRAALLLSSLFNPTPPRHGARAVTARLKHVKRTLMTTLPLGKDLNGNAYVARGSYRTADGKAQIDWTLAQRADGQHLFSSSGTFGRMGGQCLDEIAKAYPDDPTVQSMAAISAVYHLNDMKPGTPHQAALGWGHGRDVALDLATMTDAQKTALAKRNEARQGRARAKWIAEKWETLADSNRARLALWRVMHGGQAATVHDEGIMQIACASPEARKGFRFMSIEGDTLRRKVAAQLDNESRNLFPAAPVASEVFPDSIGAPCPVTGYLYGSSWLTLPIPADVIETIKGWAALDNTGGESGYDASARSFLERNGLTLRITLSDTKPATWTPAGHHYRITLSRKDTPGKLAFDFWGSKADADKRRDPSAYDVLACLSSEASMPDTIPAFFAEFGGDPDSIRERQTAARAVRFGKTLRAFFTPGELTELSEIN